MPIESLGYFGVNGADLSAWSSFATDLLGMQIGAATPSRLALRMDERQQRIMVSPDSADREYVFGWEVANAAALQLLEEQLKAAGVRVTRERGRLAQERCVEELIFFDDPVGNRLEAFHSAYRASDPFVPGRRISGFRTGELGLGHAVLSVESVEQVKPFYEEVLGFRLSDYTRAPFKAYFFNCNRRHHSLALVETGVNGLHHLMIEVCSLDDVGQAYDIAQETENGVGVTLGRHSNDLMTSFYARSPSGFLIEYGWGGVDASDCEPQEYTNGPSLWGHERSWLSPEKREEARRLRRGAAAKGIRHPVNVLNGYYQEVD